MSDLVEHLRGLVNPRYVAELVSSDLITEAADRIASLETELQALRKALEAIIDRSQNGELGTSKVIDMRKIAEKALTMEDIHREQLDRDRLKPAVLRNSGGGETS